MTDLPKTIQDRQGLNEMADFLRDGKMKGAAMVFSTLPERDQDLILMQMRSTYLKTSSRPSVRTLPTAAPSGAVFSCAHSLCKVCKAVL